MSPFASTPRIRGKRHNGFARLLVFALMTAAVMTNGVAASGQEKHAITLSADQSTISAVGVPLMTAEVTINGVAVSGRNVVFTWKVKDDPQPPQPGKISATDANGKAVYRLKNIGGRPGTVTVTAALENLPSITATADVRFELPDGFIALAELPMTLAAARTFCREQGGKLPRMNDSDSLPRADSGQITRIDGFGAPGAPWPSGLPYDRYWTGTEFTGEPAVPGRHGGSWLVGVRSGGVLVHNDGKSVTYRAVCVP
jgi:hypothetical protein